MAPSAPPAEPGTLAAPVYALTPGEVHVGTPNGAGIYMAAVGATPPADTVTAWPAAWSILGYASSDGPTVGQNTTTQDLTPWQSISPIRSVITQRAFTLHFVLWQLNDKTLGLYFDTDPATPAVDGSLSMNVRTDQAGHQYAFGIDAKDGGRVLRIIVPRGNLTQAGDMQLTRGAVVPLDCTISALETTGVLANILLGPPSVGMLLGSASPNGINHDEPVPA